MVLRRRTSYGILCFMPSKYCVISGDMLSRDFIKVALRNSLSVRQNAEFHLPSKKMHTSTLWTLTKNGVNVLFCPVLPDIRKSFLCLKIISLRPLVRLKREVWIWSWLCRICGMIMEWLCTFKDKYICIILYKDPVYSLYCHWKYFSLCCA